MLRICFLVTLLILVGLGSIQAEDDGPEGVYLGPQLGFQKANDADEGQFWGGAVLRARLTYALALEGSINYRQETFMSDQLTVRSWPVTASALFYPVSVLYGVAGMGWYHLTLDYHSDLASVFEDETQQKVGWHFGGGLELPLSDNVNFTSDIRYVFLNYDFQELPGSDDLSSNFYALMFGLVWDLGGSY